MERLRYSFCFLALAMASGCADNSGPVRNADGSTGKDVQDGGGRGASPDLALADGAREVAQGEDAIVQTNDAGDAAGALDTAREVAQGGDAVVQTNDTGDAANVLDTAREVDANGMGDTARVGDTKGVGDSGGQSAETDGCSAEQRQARQSIYQYIFIPFADLPSAAQDFLTAFLSVSYINEHLLFFTADGAPPQARVPLYFYFVDGCYTSNDTGQIAFLQWSSPEFERETAYLGPSQEWRVAISDAEAKARIEAAGCDSSNFEVAWGFDSDPHAIYPAWQAGGQEIPIPPEWQSSADGCNGPICTVNAQTGVVSVHPQACWGTCDDEAAAAWGEGALLSCK